MMPAVSSAAAGLRSTQNTCAPSRAKQTAVALPFPHPGPIEPAPTTIAVLPLSRFIDRSPFLICLGDQAVPRVGFLPNLMARRGGFNNAPFVVARLDRAIQYSPPSP